MILRYMVDLGRSHRLTTGGQDRIYLEVSLDMACLHDGERRCYPLSTQVLGYIWQDIDLIYPSHRTIYGLCIMPFWLVYYYCTSAHKLCPRAHADNGIK